jgi:hypothetical protein
LFLIVNKLCDVTFCHSWLIVLSHIFYDSYLWFSSYKDPIPSTSQKVSFFAHPNFLQSPSNNFILSWYVKACVFTLANFPSLPPSPISKYYHNMGVGGYVDDEVTKLVLKMFL